MGFSSDVFWPKRMIVEFALRLIKRYARTRLYDTQAARYVTLRDLRSWVAKGIALSLSTPKRATT
jgi:polyhydroxyalkanoate synthesis regulator protein